MSSGKNSQIFQYTVIMHVFGFFFLQFDDLTTDRTISQQDGFDYVEDLQSPR